MESGELKYHFSYKHSDNKDLQQGDVLKKTDAIKRLLKEVHPHYLDETYTGFIILSQTCDLVRRNGNPCKTRYITLGVIRPLTLLIEREITKNQDALDKAAMICKNSAKNRLSEFLKRLFNNNENEYFYIEPQSEVGMSEPSCAFLRLSISIRAYQHYDICHEARVLSLSEGFRAKLGWMVGNVYSRVGTEDWVPNSDFTKKINYTLEASTKWIDDEKLKIAKSQLFSDDNTIINELELIFQYYSKLLYESLCKSTNSVYFRLLSISVLIFLFEEFIVFFSNFDFEGFPEEIYRFLIDQVKLTNKKDEVLTKIKEILKSSDNLEEKEINKICSKISSDPMIARYLK
jgi:hypothetical protein